MYIFNWNIFWHLGHKHFSNIDFFFFLLTIPLLCLFCSIRLFCLLEQDETDEHDHNPKGTPATWHWIHVLSFFEFS